MAGRAIRLTDSAVSYPTLLGNESVGHGQDAVRSSSTMAGGDSVRLGEATSSISVGGSAHHLIETQLTMKDVPSSRFGTCVREPAFEMATGYDQSPVYGPLAIPGGVIGRATHGTPASVGGDLAPAELPASLRPSDRAATFGRAVARKDAPQRCGSDSAQLLPSLDVVRPRAPAARITPPSARDTALPSTSPGPGTYNPLDSATAKRAVGGAIAAEGGREGGGQSGRCGRGEEQNTHAVDVETGVGDTGRRDAGETNTPFGSTSSRACMQASRQDDQSVLDPKPMMRLAPAFSFGGAVENDLSRLPADYWLLATDYWLLTTDY